MTKAESAASRTPRTDAVAERRTVIKDNGRTVTADYIVNADFARTLELEAADLRERLASAEHSAKHWEAEARRYAGNSDYWRERLVKAREDFAESAMQRCYTEAAGYGVIKDASHTGPNAYAVGYQDGCAYCAELIRALAHPKGEDHGNG